MNFLRLLAIVPLLAGCVSRDLFRCGEPRGPRAYFGSTASRAITILRKADRLESSHTGYGGAPSCLVGAYRHVLRRRDAPVLFASLYRDANPVGRIYALAGLYDTDRAAFDRLVVSDITRDESSYLVIDGCVVSGISSTQIRARLQSGELSAWWRGQGDLSPTAAR